MRERQSWPSLEHQRMRNSSPFWQQKKSDAILFLFLEGKASPLKIKEAKSKTSHGWCLLWINSRNYHELISFKYAIFLLVREKFLALACTLYMESTSIYNDLSIDKLMEKFNRKLLGKNANSTQAATPSPVPQLFAQSRQHRLRRHKETEE